MANVAHRLRELAVSDSGLVFDPLTGHTYSANVTGLFIVNALKQGYSASEIPGLLSQSYELEAGDDPERDVVDFIGQLKKHSLIK